MVTNGIPCRAWREQLKVWTDIVHFWWLLKGLGGQPLAGYQPLDPDQAARMTITADERSGINLKGIQDFHPKARTRTWS
jgi:hypothetical protein